MVFSLIYFDMEWFLLWVTLFWRQYAAHTQAPMICFMVSVCVCVRALFAYFHLTLKHFDCFKNEWWHRMVFTNEPHTTSSAFLLLQDGNRLGKWKSVCKYYTAYQSIMSTYLLVQSTIFGGFIYENQPKSSCKETNKFG